MGVEIKDIYTIFVTNIKRYKVFIFIVIGYLLFFEIVFPHEPNCLIKHTIGIPCPGCGMTRALYALCTLQISEALFYHPMVLLMPFIGLVLLLNGYKIFTILYDSKVFWACIIIAFFVTYIIRMYTYFPNVEPMDFYFK